MTAWFAESLRHYPELAFFLTLALGYLLGKVRLGSFSLGSVTGVLLAGVLVGQLGVQISPNVKQTFFLLFLFAIGYRTGPQFFRGLKADGLAQAVVTVVVCVTGLLVAWLICLLFGFDAGMGTGLVAGALTESATIGTGGEAIAHLPLDDAARQKLVNAIPVAFAVAYLVGVIAVAWFLSQIAPRLIGVDLVAACRELEAQMSGGGSSDPAVVSAWRRFELRAFDLAPALAGRTVAEIEALFAPDRAFIARTRRADGTIVETTPETVLAAGDRFTLAARRPVLVQRGAELGREAEDMELLDVDAEILPVVVTRREIAGRSLDDLAAGEFARGVFLRSISRSGVDLPIFPETRIERGDVLTLVGTVTTVEAAAKRIGYADRPTQMTDMVFVGTGIVLGGLIGIPALAFGSLAIGLSTSVGVLLGGIVFGWLRSWRPLFGRIPEPALWLFESVGLAGFAAVVGISAGPDFVAGLAASGPLLLVGAIVVALVPHVVGVLVGHHLLHMHPGVLLGVCAGAGTATPALAAIQEAAKSRVPTLGYGVSYAIGNVLLALWGTIIVALLA